MTTGIHHAGRSSASRAVLAGLAGLALLTWLFAAGCTTIPEPTPPPTPPGAAELEQGITTQAVWYGMTYQGRATTSGEIFDLRRLTASHPTLPFGTRLEVLNPANGNTATVVVNDRSNLEMGDGLALSEAAAKALGIDDRRRSTVVYRLAR
jgi:rare lipoprotein A